MIILLLYISIERQNSVRLAMINYVLKYLNIQVHTYLFYMATQLLLYN